MKCDELKAYKADVTIPVYGTIADAEVYLKDKADAAIAELKAALKESEEARYEAGADAADYYQENRRLRCTLWLTRLRTLRNFSVLAYFQTLGAKGKKSNMDFDEMAYRIDLARVKCRAKAEEYKK